MPVQLPLDALRLRQLNIAAGGGGGGGGQFFMCGAPVGTHRAKCNFTSADGGGATALFPKHPILSIVILNEVPRRGKVTRNTQLI